MLIRVACNSHTWATMRGVEGLGQLEQFAPGPHWSVCGVCVCGGGGGGGVGYSKFYIAALGPQNPLGTPDKGSYDI